VIPEKPQLSEIVVPAATAEDVAGILRRRGWLDALTPERETWLADAAALLGPHAPDHAALGDLLGLIFHYDAPAMLAQPQSQEVLTRVGARAVIRELANRVLGGPEMDSDRFKQIVSEMKETLRFRGRELFQPIRLALAGRTGEGQLDRVILLLDPAAKLEFPARVKGVKQRMLEFCAAMV
jgi:glutamyl/glutaminyl-tRNA synthetase